MMGWLGKNNFVENIKAINFSVTKELLSLEQKSGHCCFQARFTDRMENLFFLIFVSFFARLLS